MSGELLEEASQMALHYYQEAYKIKLPACNFVRLGLVLNFSVFQSEVLNNIREASNLAHTALTEAFDKIDELE